MFRSKNFDRFGILILFLFWFVATIRLCDKYNMIIDIIKLTSCDFLFVYSKIWVRMWLRIRIKYFISLSISLFRTHFLCVCMCCCARAIFHISIITHLFSREITINSIYIYTYFPSKFRRLNCLKIKIKFEINVVNSYVF